MNSRFVTSFFDALWLMLILRELSFQLHKPYLAIGYFTSWLIMAVSLCIIPGNEYAITVREIQKWPPRKRFKGAK